MQVTFLEGSEPLVKHYTLTEKHPYPNVRDFTTHVHDIQDLPDFSKWMQHHAAKGHCLLKGNTDRQLRQESRAGHTDSSAPTHWLCLDIDGMSSVSTVDHFMDRCGLGDVDYLLQWSSSYGVHNQYDLRCHVYVLLDQPAQPEVLKIWLKHLNLSRFAADLKLTATAMALRWGLDISTCQNDKLLYIAPPTFSESSICTFTGQRITLIRKTTRTAGLTTMISGLSPETVREREIDAINELRKKAGLKAKSETRLSPVSLNGMTLLKNPSQASVTGTKCERGFVYLNLNGGDSFAYYHPEDNFEYIHNFKGEPSYRTSELIPEYHAELTKLARKNVSRNREILAFRDRRTATYWNGYYDPQVPAVELYPAKSEKQLNDWMAEHLLPPFDSIPIWERVFDPRTNTLYDEQKQWVNLFSPTKYMLASANQSVAQQATPFIDRVIANAVGPSNVERFTNWLAFMFQRRERPMTAWILHGVQGTGKGVMINKILKPIFGRQHVPEIRMSQLKEQFNSYLESALLVAVDEVQISETGKAGEIMADLKNYITEPTTIIRRMRTDAYEVPNYAGWLFCSNMPDPVVISHTDRRFNVGEFQRIPLLNVMSIKDIDYYIPRELEAFSQRLATWPVDVHAAQTAAMSDSKAKVQKASMQSADIVAHSILTGDMEELVATLPDTSTKLVTLDPNQTEARANYETVIKDILLSRRDKFTRDELRAIFRYQVGKNVPDSPNKFTRYLSHHGIEIHAINHNGKTVRGYRLEHGWIQTQDWFDAKCKEHGLEVAQPAAVAQLQPSTEEPSNGRTTTGKQTE